MKVDEELVMALPRKLVEHAILGLQDPINEHLVKLTGFDFADEQRQHFRREMRTRFRKIQRLRITPNNRTGSEQFYYNLLFDYPFGGVEIQNTRSLSDQISEEYGLRPLKTPEELIERLHGFHEKLAERLHQGEDALDMIPE